jgi:hypothetical protein
MRSIGRARRRVGDRQMVAKRQGNANEQDGHPTYQQFFRIVVHPSTYGFTFLAQLARKQKERPKAVSL